MSRYNTVYYLLILLLVTGAFASMAQNTYGIKIMGAVAAAFSAIFLFQAINKETSIFQTIELSGLAVLAAIISLRTFYIHFPYAELVYGLAGISIFGVYSYKLIILYPRIRKENSFLSTMVLLFFGSLSLFVLSLTITPFMPSLAEPVGMAAFALIILFAITSLVKKEVLYEGEKVNALKIASRSEPRALMLLALFTLFSLYIGLNKINLIPSIYSDEYPRAYFELVSRAESGDEESQDGEYKHDRFQQEYEKFIEKHSDTFEY
ncbi:MAG: hypothetical protein R3283_04090 [Balneolaceae bacterium]|nr:hypothetical protein [Balneolaceae bacterium]